MKNRFIAIVAAAALFAGGVAFGVVQGNAAQHDRGGSSAVARELKQLNKQVGDANDYLHDIERHTSGTCRSTNDFAGTFNSSYCATIYSH